MKAASEYRAYAEECRTLARQMDGGHREQLLDMARTWDKLAAEATADLVPPDSERAPRGRREDAAETPRVPAPRA